MNLKHCALAIALATTATPFAALAESSVASGSGDATARVDFRITIPRILLLQVGGAGSGSPIELISFTADANDLQNLGTPVAADAGSGDLGNGTVSARVLGNNGQVSLSATTTGALTNPTGDTISYAEITTASSSANLPAPALADNTTTSVPVPVTAGKITDANAEWTYTYDNTAMAAPGQYGGVNINNSRVTYTASMP